MTKRLIAVPLALAVLGGILAGATAAKAETCVSLPPTTGATIEAAGQKVRVPATSGVAACVEPGGLPGLPRVDSGGGTVSIVLGAGSTASGYVVVRYTLDGSPNQISVPIPGGGGGSETCLASVGEIARPDCLVKVSIDDIPDPPPTPSPSIPPIPPVSPEPICFSFGLCIPPSSGDIKDLINDLRDPVGYLCWKLQEILVCNVS
ncbi:MAG: hypothetical protein M3323_11470 [Actinomycetota bacterium]|nr:hypothetical protein [Actinomycetota bacterium]